MTTAGAIPAALVTGANKGIGLAVARGLAQQGYFVWLGCRSLAAGEAALDKVVETGGAGRAIQLDVVDPESIARAAAAVSAASDRLDALVNNAGISLGYRHRPSEEPVDDTRTIFDVNVFGTLRVTQAFLPLLRRAPAPRIVMVSSGLGSLAAASDAADPGFGFNFLGYRSSKTALNAATIALAKDLAGENIRVNAADPGFTATDLNGHSGPRSPDDAARIIVALATDDAPGTDRTGQFLDERGSKRW